MEKNAEVEDCYRRQRICLRIRHLRKKYQSLSKLFLTDQSFVVNAKAWHLYVLNCFCLYVTCAWRERDYSLVLVIVLRVYLFRNH